MKKNCDSCRFSRKNTGGNYCPSNPNSPDNIRNHRCIGFLLWQSIPYKPSDMDLLALESLRDGKPVYRANGVKGIVNRIDKKSYQVESVFVVKIHPDKPCVDLTKDEVKKHLFEKVWTWDDKNDLAQRKLIGYLEGENFPYATNGNWHEHASLNKPNL